MSKSFIYSFKFQFHVHGNVTVSCIKTKVDLLNFVERMDNFSKIQ